MADDTATQAAGSVETQSDFGKSPSELVKNWLLAIALADSEEEDYRKDGEDALKVYKAESLDRSRYNILYANEQTIIPALYNSEPAPDIRRRYGDGPAPAPQMPQAPGQQEMAPQAPPPPDPGKQAAQALERGISIQAEMYNFDACMRAAVFDMRLPGRGVSRVRVVSGENGSKRVICEPVKWDDFRRGPATAWDLVPWVAYRHRLTRDELKQLTPKLADKVPLDVTIAPDDKKGGDKQELPDIFKRAVVWEIWDLSTRKVVWVAESYKDAPLAQHDDPYRLRGFFPSPKPLYAIAVTDSLAPVCPFRVWKYLADEMNTYTTRIGAIVKVMKLRGLYDGAFAGAISKLQDLNDGELAPVEDAARILQQGGLDKGIWVWPIEKVIAVVEGLYEARDRCKATIYEITGVADILRGQTDPDETLGAQQIKAQWGSIRLQDAQKDVANYARDLFRMMGDLLAEFWDEAQWAAATNIQLTEETLKLLKSDLQREFSIEIETDSTIRADLGRAQQNIGLFIQGLSQFTQSVGPIVQAGMMQPQIAVKLIGSFARNFKLGREAEDTIEEWARTLDQQAGQPKPPSPEEDKAKMEMAIKQQEAQAKQAEQAATLQFKQQEHQMDLEAKQAELALKHQELELKERELGMKMQAMQQEQTMQAQTREAEHAFNIRRLQEEEKFGADKRAAELDFMQKRQAMRPSNGAAQ